MQTAKVLQYPTGARIMVQNLVGQFLRTTNYKTMDLTLETMKNVLIKEGLTKLHCNTFSVELGRNGRVIFDTSIISTNEHCPKCGKYFVESKSLPILEGYKFGKFRRIDKYIYGCKCGTVYAIYWEVE